MQTELLAQVASFSDKVIATLPGAKRRSPWQSVRVGQAARWGGVVVHYTADPDMWSVLRWFLLERLTARVSAHYVVGAAWDNETRAAASGLPLVTALPVPVIEAVQPTETAWHARGANAWALGIEVVNAGQLRRAQDGTFLRWQPRNAGAPEWTSQYNMAGGRPTMCTSDGVYWYAPYAAGQEEATAQVVRALEDLGGAPFENHAIVGHEHVQRNKHDPGPAFVLERVRHTSTMTRQAAAKLLPKVVDSGAIALLALGYADAGRESVEMFQRMMGITADGEIGPETRAAIEQRLLEVGFKP